MGKQFTEKAIAAVKPKTVRYYLREGRGCALQVLLSGAKDFVYVLQLNTIMTGIGTCDALGAITISLLTLRKGKEAFGKAKGMDCLCGTGCRRQYRRCPGYC